MRGTARGAAAAIIVTLLATACQGGGTTARSDHRPSAPSLPGNGAGDPVTGTLNAAKTVWHSRWTLDVSQRYTVTATAAGEGRSASRTVSFRTLTPRQRFTTEITEAGPDGSTFPSPATLPPSTATAPLGTAAAGNANV